MDILSATNSTECSSHFCLKKKKNEIDDTTTSFAERIVQISESNSIIQTPRVHLDCTGLQAFQNGVPTTPTNRCSCSDMVQFNMGAEITTSARAQPSMAINASLLQTHS